MSPPNISVNIDKNSATANSSEKSHDITTIDFSINKSFSTPKCLHLETPLEFAINNDLNKTKLNDINKTSCSSNIPEKPRTMRSKISENKKLTNQLENTRQIKHHLYLQNRIKIQGNTSTDTSMALVNNRENSIKISTTKHLTKSTNHKTEVTEVEEVNSTPAKDITEETTAESFYNTFDKKDQNAATEALKEKVANQISETQNGEKEEVDQRAKKLKETVFIVGDSMIEKIDGYLLTKSINYKFLVKVRPLQLQRQMISMTILFIIHVGTNDLPLNKTSNKIAEGIINLAESIKKPAETL